MDPRRPPSWRGTGGSPRRPAFPRPGGGAGSRPAPRVRTPLSEEGPSIFERFLANARLGVVADALREDRLQLSFLGHGERHLIVRIVDRLQLALEDVVRQRLSSDHPWCRKCRIELVARGRTPIDLRLGDLP